MPWMLQKMWFYPTYACVNTIGYVRWYAILKHNGPVSQIEVRLSQD